jgi:hypothetical protein
MGRSFGVDGVGSTPDMFRNIPESRSHFFPTTLAAAIMPDPPRSRKDL